MTEILMMTVILAMTFAMGLYVGDRRARRRRRRRIVYSDFGNFMPTPNPDPQFDEEYWKQNPPPFHIGGSAGERR